MSTTKTIVAALMLMLFASSALFAQSQYDLRLNLNSADCDNNTVTADIEVRVKAGLPSFNISDQNYRISYDNSMLTNPRISQELEISGQKLNSDYSAFFDPHHLNGTTANFISYNVVLSGGSGYPVDDTRWYPVGQIQFDVLDIEGSVVLDFVPHGQFPATFVGNKIGGAGGTLLEMAEGNYQGVNVDKLTCEKTLAITPALAIDAEWSAQVFPNPVKNEMVTVQFTSTRSSEGAELVISDELGRIVKRIDQQVVAGENTMTFSAKSLAVGIYFVQVKDSEGESAVQKLVKLGE